MPRMSRRIKGEKIDDDSEAEYVGGTDSEGSDEDDYLITIGGLSKSQLCAIAKGSASYHAQWTEADKAYVVRLGIQRQFNARNLPTAQDTLDLIAAWDIPYHELGMRATQALMSKIFGLIKNLHEDEQLAGLMKTKLVGKAGRSEVHEVYIAQVLVEAVHRDTFSFTKNDREELQRQHAACGLNYQRIPNKTGITPRMWKQNIMSALVKGQYFSRYHKKTSMPAPYALPYQTPPSGPKAYMMPVSAFANYSPPPAEMLYSTPAAEMQCSAPPAPLPHPTPVSPSPAYTHRAQPAHAAMLRMPSLSPTPKAPVTYAQVFDHSATSIQESVKKTGVFSDSFVNELRQMGYDQQDIANMANRKKQAHMNYLCMIRQLALDAITSGRSAETMHKLYVAWEQNECGLEMLPGKDYSALSLSEKPPVDAPY